LVPLDAAQPVESVGHETGLSAQVVSQAIDRLDPIQRDVVVLKLLRGLSFGEVAEVVGATEAACKMRFRRGMDRLRDDLEKRGVDS
jgi:RNA polymerase sigma-70 factor (ECF subfamily)